MRICSVERCKRKHNAKNYCKMHYDRFLRYGDPLIYKKESHWREGTPEYRVWHGIKDRCLNKSHPHYKDYGGRGITICDKWRNSFIAFSEDMGVKPFSRACIDRIDNNGNYEPGNCRWTTFKINNRNSRAAKLTMKLAEQIRKEYIPHVVTQLMLAKKYDVDRTTICDILRKRTWR